MKAPQTRTGIPSRTCTPDALTAGGPWRWRWRSRSNRFGIAWARHKSWASSFDGWCATRTSWTTSRRYHLPTGHRPPTACLKQSLWSAWRYHTPVATSRSSRTRPLDSAPTWPPIRHFAMMVKGRWYRRQDRPERAPHGRSDLQHRLRTSRGRRAAGQPVLSSEARLLPRK